MSKFCSNCGKELDDKANFCGGCGNVVNNVSNYYQATCANQDSYSGMGIAGFVLSLIVPLLGLIFSAIAVSDIKKTGKKGYGLALAGLIISISWFALAIFAYLLSISLFF